MLYSMETGGVVLGRGLFAGTLPRSTQETGLLGPRRAAPRLKQTEQK
jgi:hypothetical protein